MIEPNWILLFSKKRGRWWVRLLACGRYHHVKAIAYLPAVRSWLFYDVKFNGTRLLLAPEGDAASHAFVLKYLADCDLVAMPRLPVPKRVAPHAGFWCTLAMKHLVGVRTATLRPDQLLRDCVAAGGKLYETGLAEKSSMAAASMTPLKGPQPSDPVLSILKTHAQTSNSNQHPWSDDAALGRQRSELIKNVQARIRALRAKTSAGDRGRPCSVTASARC